MVALAAATVVAIIVVGVAAVGVVAVRIVELSDWMKVEQVASPTGLVLRQQPAVKVLLLVWCHCCKGR